MATTKKFGKKDGLIYAFAVKPEPEKEEEKESFWEKIGSYAGQIGLTAAANVGTKYLEGAIAKGLTHNVEENKNAWLAHSKELTAENFSAQSYIHSMYEKHKEMEAANTSRRDMLRTMIGPSLTDKFEQELTSKGFKPWGLEEGIAISDIKEPQYQILYNHYVDSVIDANEGEFGKQYDKLIDMASKTTIENKDEYLQRLANSSRYSDTIFGQLKNKLTGTDPLAESVAHLENSPEYNRYSEVKKAVDVFKALKTQTAAKEVATAAMIAERMENISSANFEDVSQAEGSDVFYGDDGKLYSQKGIWRIHTHRHTGDIRYEFIGVGDRVESTRDQQLFNSAFGQNISARINNMLTGRIHSRNKAINRLAYIQEKFPGLDLHNLSSHLGEKVGTKNYQGKDGFKLLQEDARAITNLLIDFENNKESYNPTIAEWQKTILTGITKEQEKNYEKLRTSLESEFSPDYRSKVTEEQIVEEIRKAKLIDAKLNKIRGGVETGAISATEDGKTALIIGYKLDENDIPFPDPNATNPDGTGITIGQYVVYNKRYELWNTHNKTLPLSTEQAIYKSVENADELVFEDGEPTEAGRKWLGVEIDETETEVTETESPPATDEGGYVPPVYSKEVIEQFDNFSLEDYPDVSPESSLLEEDVAKGMEAEETKARINRIESRKKELTLSVRRDIVEPLGLDVRYDADEIMAKSDWYNKNLDKLAAAMENPLVDDLYKKEGIPGLIEKYYKKNTESLLSKQEEVITLTDTKREGVPYSVDIDLPTFWAKFYNAEHVTAKNPDKKLAQQIARFKNAANMDVLPEVRESAVAAFESGAFDGELKNLGITRDQAANYLSEISKVESSGGSNNTISTGGAAGYFQVIPSTFRSLIENEGVIGRKALAYLGKTKDELLGMSNQEIQNYLQKDQTAGATFGAAALVSKLAAAQRTLFP